MARRQPFVNVSAVVPPALAQEIDRMAAAHKVSRSTMVRQLLEERLTQRADERMVDAYAKLEERLKKMETRFSGLIVKDIRLTAQALFVTAYQVREFTEITKGEYQELQEKARAFAGDQLKQASENE
jgi:metal-responsive CopG/Arc/MetJ family transcriptional regulator